MNNRQNTFSGLNLLSVGVRVVDSTQCRIIGLEWVEVSCNRKSCFRIFEWPHSTTWKTYLSIIRFRIKL